MLAKLHRAQKHIRRAIDLNQEGLLFGHAHRRKPEKEKLDSVSVEELDSSLIVIKGPSYNGLIHNLRVRLEGTRVALLLVQDSALIEFSSMIIKQDKTGKTFGFINDFNFSSRLDLRENFARVRKLRHKTYDTRAMDAKYIFRVLLIIAFRVFPDIDYVELQDLSGPLVDGSVLSNVHALLGNDRRTFYVKEGFLRSGVVRRDAESQMKCMREKAVHVNRDRQLSHETQKAVNYCLHDGAKPDLCFEKLRGEPGIQGSFYACVKQNAHLTDDRMYMTKEAFEDLNRAREGLYYTRDKVTVFIDTTSMRAFLNRISKLFEMMADIRDHKQMSEIRTVYNAVKKCAMDIEVMDKARQILNGDNEISVLEGTSDEDFTLLLYTLLIVCRHNISDLIEIFAFAMDRKELDIETMVVAWLEKNKWICGTNIMNAMEIQKEKPKKMGHEMKSLVMNALSNTLTSIREGNPQTGQLRQAAEATKNHEPSKGIYDRAVDVLEAMKKTASISRQMLMSLMHIAKSEAFVREVYRATENYEVIDEFLNEYEDEKFRNKTEDCIKAELFENLFKPRAGDWIGTAGRAAGEFVGKGMGGRNEKIRVHRDGRVEWLVETGSLNRRFERQSYPMWISIHDDTLRGMVNQHDHIYMEMKVAKDKIRMNLLTIKYNPYKKKMERVSKDEQLFFPDTDFEKEFENRESDVGKCDLPADVHERGHDVPIDDEIIRVMIMCHSLFSRETLLDACEELTKLLKVPFGRISFDIRNGKDDCYIDVRIDTEQWIQALGFEVDLKYFKTLMDERHFRRTITLTLQKIFGNHIVHVEYY
jgi:hypothetical protein